MFFFKRKTAYEMRISDWSSDVCSSDRRDCLIANTYGLNTLRPSIIGSNPSMQVYGSPWAAIQAKEGSTHGNEEVAGCRCNGRCRPGNRCLRIVTGLECVPRRSQRRQAVAFRFHGQELRPHTQGCGTESGGGRDGKRVGGEKGVGV